MQIEKVPFYARFALTLLGIGLVLFLLSFGKSIFIPLFFALLVSILMYPIASRLEKWKMRRGIASFIAVLIFILGVAAFFYFFTNQIINFSKDVPVLEKKLETFVTNIQSWVSYKYHIDTTEQMSYINKSADGLLNTAANSLGNIFINILSIIILSIFMLIYTYFMLYHRGLLMHFILSLFKPQHRAKTFEVVTEAKKMINNYVLGLLIEMLILAVFNCGVFMILGIKYALLLGLLAATLNIIPYLGIYTALVIGVLVTYANGSGGQALSLGVALLIIHFIDANILLPRIVGGRVKMNPFITIVAVISGHLIWGIPGMFLFIPLTAIVKIVCERVDGLKPWAILIGTEEKAPEE